MLTNLRLAQLYAVLRLELKKTFLSRRGIWVYLLALSPVALFGLHSAQMIHQHRPCDFGMDTNIFATVFQTFYLRLAVFFGCLGIFMNLFRGEVLDKSLHFYFLSPIRREVLLAGKFIAGLVAASVIFGLSVLVQFAALYAHFDSATMTEYLLRGGGIGHLAAYVGVAVLGCLGYGSVFLAAGILMRNPIIPAAVMLVWEGIDPILPSVLKKFSVIYYLEALCPLEVVREMPGVLKLLIVNPDRISPVLAVFGLFALSALVIFWSSMRLKKMEIQYSTE